MGTTQNKLVTSHQYNKRHKQAVAVLNKVEYDSEGDGNLNPIGMMEDPSNPTSANFGTPREPRRGGCYKGNGSSYIEIIGLLPTDTVEVFDGSDIPTISDDRLDIASGNRIFGVKIFRAGELWAKYNCSENSDSICYDSSGNGNHGTIINAITTTPEENPNSIHQYQDVYSFENEEGYSSTLQNTQLGFDRVVPNITGILQNDGSYLYTTITNGNWTGVYIDYINLPRGLRFNIGDRWRFTAEVKKLNTGDILPFYHTNFILTNASGNRGGVVGSDWTSFVWEGILSIIPAGGIQMFLMGTNQGVECYIKLNWEYLSGSLDNVLAPKNSSITLPPFKDVHGNNLQYVGKVPGKSKFVGSNCFKHNTDTGNTGLKFKTTISVLFYEISFFTYREISGSNNVYYTFASSQFGYFVSTTRVFQNSYQLTNTPKIPIDKLTKITVKRYSDNFKIYHNDVLVNSYTGTHDNTTLAQFTHIGRGASADGYSIAGSIWNFKIKELDASGNYVQTLGHWPLCEPIVDLSNHIYHDVSGNGNHATLVNVTLANNGKQDKFHYLQRGFNKHLQVCDNRHLVSTLLPRVNDNGIWRGFTLYGGAQASYSIINSSQVLELYSMTSSFGSYFSTSTNLLGVFEVYVEVFIPTTSNILLVTINDFALADRELINGYAMGTSEKGVWVTLALKTTRVGSYRNMHFTHTASEYGLTTTNFYIRKIEFRKLEDKFYPGVDGGVDGGVDVNGESLIYKQDSHSFLNTGTELEAYDYPELKQADKDDNFWYIGDAGVRRVSHYELAIENLMSDKIFLDRTDKNIQI